MPDRKSLIVGDRIRILAVPALDQQAMVVAMRKGDPTAQGTTRVLQRLADRKHVVRIDQLAPDGTPWFSYSFKNKANSWEHHYLSVVDDESWEFVDRQTLLSAGTNS